MTTINPQIDASTRFSTMSEWAIWLAKQEAVTLSVYLQKPSLLIADYNREKEVTRDYEGREILELLQNANDAAADKSEMGKVVIDLASHSGMADGNLLEVDFNDVPSRHIDDSAVFAACHRQILSQLSTVLLHSWAIRRNVALPIENDLWVP